MNPWKDKTIKLNDSWGPITNTVLRVPLGCAPEFSLRARYLRDSRGVRQLGQLRAEIPSGYLSDGWQGATFTPLGTNPVEGICGLPPWDPSQAKFYRELIDGPNNNLADPGTQRLEAAIAYLGADGAIGYDIVRLYYAFNAVEGATLSDLIVVKRASSLGAVGPLDDGGASGPPD